MGARIEWASRQWRNVECDDSHCRLEPDGGNPSQCRHRVHVRGDKPRWRILLGRRRSLSTRKRDIDGRTGAERGLWGDKCCNDQRGNESHDDDASCGHRRILWGRRYRTTRKWQSPSERAHSCHRFLKSLAQRPPHTPPIQSAFIRSPNVSLAFHAALFPARFIFLTTVRGPVIKVEGLGVRYGDFWAVRDAHVKLEPGVIQAIVGENGAGKSTLLRSQAGRGLRLLRSRRPAPNWCPRSSPAS